MHLVKARWKDNLSTFLRFESPSFGLRQIYDILIVACALHGYLAALQIFEVSVGVIVIFAVCVGFLAHRIVIHAWV